LQQAQQAEAGPMFSIAIPSWNNLPYLRLCVDRLQRAKAALMRRFG
jgi:hypothetical protein